jgi:hypothetical protein
MELRRIAPIVAHVGVVPDVKKNARNRLFERNRTTIQLRLCIPKV